MQRKIRAQIEKAKKFTQEHPTLVACAATGVISWKVSHNRTLKSMGNEIGALYEQTYAAGFDVGALEVQLAVLLDFINSRDLGDEVRLFVSNLQD